MMNLVVSCVMVWLLDLLLYSFDVPKGAGSLQVTENKGTFIS